MKNSKKWFVLGCSVLTIMCFTNMSKPSKLKAFRIVEATSQQVHSGIRGGMNATNYNLKVVIQTNDLVAFDSLVFSQGFQLPVTVDQGLNNWNKPIKQWDTILVVCSITDQFMADFSRKPVAEPSIASNNAGSDLLVYSVGKKKLIYKLPAFQKLAPLNMQ